MFCLCLSVSFSLVSSLSELYPVCVLALLEFRVSASTRNFRTRSELQFHSFCPLIRIRITKQYYSVVWRYMAKICYACERVFCLTRQKVILPISHLNYLVQNASAWLYQSSGATMMRTLVDVGDELVIVMSIVLLD